LIAMIEHKFKIGQLVYWDAKKSGLRWFTPRGHYKVLKRLPAVEGEFQYVIRSTDGSHERVARERELRGAG
jgi:hypothetical protein